jgi:anti-sigma regulatory factor (Ser/Thr protein kinase)
VANTVTSPAERGADRDPQPRAITRDLDTNPSADIRALIRALLGDRPRVLMHDAMMVADELVTNAQRHGHSPRICRLALVNDGWRLRIEVEDTAPGQPRIRTPDDTGGRGLIMVRPAPTECE